MSLRERLFPQSTQKDVDLVSQQKMDELQNLLAVQMSPTPTSGLVH